ncbi:hypothetical protein [Sphingomonas humi]|uniref:Uncharacterized protein n=1 Tax=Sphingomonas humi TaxID=335630 RepID=A0ABP7S006_9SPHN
MATPATPATLDDSTPLAQRLALAGEGATRLDGWTPARMAAFVDALAATGCVETACAHVGMAKSGLYEARRRNPLFALAWEDALLDGALPRLADELLTHAFKGSVERYYRDGELTGERHFTDTRLGLALLKRLDRKAAERAAADKAAAEKERLAAAQAARIAARDAEFAGFGKVDEVDDRAFIPTLDHPHPRIVRTPTGWQTSFPPPADRAAEDEARAFDDGCEDFPFGGDTFDPLVIQDLAPEDRWPGSPGYKRYCTVAEETALDRWVDRQFAPVHAEHARFFDVFASHGGNDDTGLLLPPGDGAPTASPPSLQA